MHGWSYVRIQENLWAGGVFRSPSGLLVLFILLIFLNSIFKDLPDVSDDNEVLVAVKCCSLCIIENEVNTLCSGMQYIH